MFKMKYNLMDEAGAGDGAGSGDAGGASGDAGNQGGNWRDSLSEDLRNNDSLSKFTDINALAKSYVNAESMIGKDKIVLPTNESEWSEAYNKLGRPETAEGYDVSLPENTPIDENFFSGFKQAAHDAGLNQAQLQKLTEWYTGETGKAIQDQQLSQENAYNDSVAALKHTWGEKFDQNLNLANRVLDQFGSDELSALLDQTGLDNNPVMTEFLFNVSKLSSEGTLEQGQGQADSLDPTQIQDKINELMATNAYVDKMDPGHTSTVGKVQKLFGRLHGAR